MEVEDDVFFADLSKRISLLIMDDEDDKELTASHYPSMTLQAFSHVCHSPIATPSMLACEQTCRRESKGTGVFIPRSTFPRRKIRSGRSAPFNTTCQQPQKSREVSHATNNPDISRNYCNSRVLRRHD
ncbi:uncharacterized protein LOC131231513 [Magnolia sinica]|uniref:uncharacterized protein LOC131231513 n=1 Tax=Magnolia sinica TaxID=86752 RepID=UPI00265B50B1|nr:uncharacterized protein LOC131231513 [Magnolia sinica]